ncbi:heavy metal-associated isoprenylated plant protein 45-like isoform X2 [Ananas comosus]|uniref:Heavy metal-associated isoprenylated plant protein 45-like isoform X2 n=1 Tax=Ananas comosus TaxID=4615 RepID=A0A6P5GMH0_ANACO|nr:heavy metal-associated isoprenylated plant protein 45-like isoform X2 [Ananas comosus]
MYRNKGNTCWPGHIHVIRQCEYTNDLTSKLPYFTKTIELKVDMVALHEKRVRKCLSKVKGIEKVEVEASIQKVTVTGYANRNKILKALRRVGLRAECWSPQNEILSAYATGTLMFNNFNFF